MQLHISPSLRHVTVFPGKGVREFIKVKAGSRRVSYRMLFYSLLFFTFLLRFVFVMTAVDSLDGETKCSSIGTNIYIIAFFLFFIFIYLFSNTNTLIYYMYDCIGLYHVFFKKLALND